ncbi:putative Cleavage stimulation factor subunit 1 [Blattamonas nauphoetae]|uniref:Cleavage stimulation factor 50 kDa subunit n=1 Tax=Blattamonas nauphoetae TaxID=2049346 RepID=A0ABQ9YL18_9EUKA|nr:putative Cleavage stimulation factor subunit 1 [Blattamonas nauphoetae]
MKAEFVDNRFLESPLNPSLSIQRVDVYNTHYIIQHQGNITALASSNNGAWVATGAKDNCVKLLSTPNLRKPSGFVFSNPLSSAISAAPASENAGGAPGSGGSLLKPIMKTFYNHDKPITALTFHPLLPFLFSAAEDKSIKFFDMTKTNQQNCCVAEINDSAIVRSMAFNPSGDFLVVGAEDPILRLYDINTRVALCDPVLTDHHHNAIRLVDFASHGRVYASTCEDGDLKIWDTTINRPVILADKLFKGRALSTMTFSKNGKYILTCPQSYTTDACLYDLRYFNELKPVVTYSHLRSKSDTAQVDRGSYPILSFSSDESHVFGSFSVNNTAPPSIHLWDTRTGRFIRTMESGHKGIITALTSTKDNCNGNWNTIITGSTDNRIRVWFN